MEAEPATLVDQNLQNNVDSSNSESTAAFLASVQGEISLFRAVTRARPIGIHRHFHMMCILRQIQKETGEWIDGHQVWKKLKEMYDLDTLNDLEEAAEDDYNGFVRSPSPSEILSNHPFFKQEYSLYSLPRDMDLDTIMDVRRSRDTLSVDSESDILPPFKPEPPPVQTGPKKRGRKRKHPLPPPPPAPPKPEETRIPTPSRQTAVPGSDSEISALTENSEVDVESTLKTENEPKPLLRASVVAASTPGSMGEEVEIVEIATPPAPPPVATRPPPAKRGRKPKGGGQVVPQDPGHVPRKRGRPPKHRPPPPPPPPPAV